MTMISALARLTSAGKIKSYQKELIDSRGNYMSGTIGVNNGVIGRIGRPQPDSAKNMLTQTLKNGTTLTAVTNARGFLGGTNLNTPNTLLAMTAGYSEQGDA